MAKSCGGKNADVNPSDPCTPPESPCCASGAGQATQKTGPFAWVDHMIMNCLEFAQEANTKGNPIVGIMCEYTPRELIMAAGAVPVCLCGGSADTIPDAEEQLPSNLCPLIKSTMGAPCSAANCSTALRKVWVTGGKTIGEGMGKPICSRMKVINPPGNWRYLTYPFK